MKKLLSEIITAWWSEVDTKLVNPKSEEAIKGLKLVLREDFGFDSDVIDYVVEMVRSTPTNFDLGGKTSGIDVGKNQTAVSAQLHPVWDDDEEDDDEDDVYNNNDGELSEWDVTLLDGLDELNEDVWVKNEKGSIYTVKNFDPETHTKLTDDEIEAYKKSQKAKGEPIEDDPSGDEEESGEEETQQQQPDNGKPEFSDSDKVDMMTQSERDAIAKKKAAEKVKNQSDSTDQPTDNEKSFKDLKKEYVSNPEVLDDLDNFQKYLDKQQKAALELEGRKKVNRLKELDSLRESFKDLPDDVKNTAKNIFAKGQTYDGRPNSGIGKNRLGYLDVKNLSENKDYLIEAYGDGSPEKIEKFVDNSRPIKVTEDYVNSSFDLLPDSLQKALSGKGKVGDAGKDKHFLGYMREDGSVTTDKNDPNIKKGEDGKPEVK